MRTITLYTAQEVAEIIKREPDAVFYATHVPGYPQVFVHQYGFVCSNGITFGLSRFDCLSQREFIRREA